MDKISRFVGYYYFLSNFYPVQVEFEGIIYPSAEHAYQAAKTLDPMEREKFLSGITAGKAKRMGRSLTLRSDWEEVKLRIMEEVVRSKFNLNPSLRISLLETGVVELEEGNDWGDTFWGVWNGRGKNYLGKILMKIRGEMNPPVAQVVRARVL